MTPLVPLDARTGNAGILTPEAYSATIWALLLATLLGPYAFRLSMKLTPCGLDAAALPANTSANAQTVDLDVELDAVRVETRSESDGESQTAAAIER